MSLDIDHSQKMKALNELIRLEKESKRRDITVLVASIVINLVVSLVTNLP